LAAQDDLWEVYDELLALVQAGLTPYEALVTSTRNIAEYFGRLDELGTVAVGKQADLALLDGNPLANIRSTLEPAGVMIRGHWLDRTALDRQLVAFPGEWLRLLLRNRRGSGGHDVNRSPPGGEAGRVHMMNLMALPDSLALAKADRAAYTRLLGRLAAELGALRALVTPERQREWLDPDARAWMREQARQGYTVTVPGVPPTGR
jgi:predicted amidohydrolase YtcJ